MFCKHCGKEINEKAVMCVHCGCRTGYAEKSKVVAALLAFFFGGLGLHRFYMGNIGLGVFYLACGTIGAAVTYGLIAIPLMIVFIIEAILFLSGNDEEFNRRCK